MGLEEEIKRMDFRSIVFTAIVTALAFVVGLFWKDAIVGAIDTIVPKGEGLTYKFLAAIIVTIIVVIIIYVMLHAQKVADERIKKLEEMGIKRLKLLKKSQETG